MNDRKKSAVAVNAIIADLADNWDKETDVKISNRSGRINGGMTRRGSRHSLEARNKMSEAAKISNTVAVRKKKSQARIGKKLTNEVKMKLSKINKGKTLSKETRDKISTALEGIDIPKAREASILRRKEIVKEQGYLFKHTEEHKRKLSEKLKGKPAHVNSRKAIELTNEERKKPVSIEGIQYNSISEAARILGRSCTFVRKRVLHQEKWKDYFFVDKP